jgi:hypothetical protein
VSGAAGTLGAALALGVLGLVVRYLVAINAGHARPRLFYVREASIPIDAEDLVFEPLEPRVPVPVQGSR